MSHWRAILTILTTVASLLALGAGNSSAQSSGADTPRSLHVYVTGGVAAPVGVFSERFKTGAGGGLALGLAPRSMSDGEIELILRAQVEKCSPQTEDFAKITFLSGGLDIKYNFHPRNETNVYLLMGGGITQTKWSEWALRGHFQGARDEMDLYGEAGIGFEHRVGIAVPFFQMRLKDVTGRAMGNYFFFKFEAGLRL